MNRTVWIFPTLVLAGVLGLFVWIQQGQSQPQAAVAVNDNAAVVMATTTKQPALPAATATSAPAATPTIVNLTPLPTTISGVVVDAQGVVAGAIVQLHGPPAQFK